MGVEKFAAGAGKATWDNYKSSFFKWLERKAKEGAKRYGLLGKMRDVWMKVDWGLCIHKNILNHFTNFTVNSMFLAWRSKILMNFLQMYLLLRYNLNLGDLRIFPRNKEKINGMKLVFQYKRGEKLFRMGRTRCRKNYVSKTNCELTLLRGQGFYSIIG